MTNHPRFRAAGCGKVAMLRSLIVRLLIAPFGVVVAATIPARAVDLDELTVVTLAGDGAWGVATAGSQGQAIAAAIRGCRARAATPSDCGAQLTTARGGWVVGNLCGRHQIMVAAETREHAEHAALVKEMNLKQLYGLNLPPCRRVLIVDPRGAVHPGRAPPAPQTDAQRRR